jgi:hypothetical protein
MKLEATLLFYLLKSGLKKQTQLVLFLNLVGMLGDPNIKKL